MAYNDRDRDPRREHTALRVPRSRGAMSGLLLVLLGLWGALIPFFGPWFDYAFTPDDSFNWTTGRFWMEVLPGAVTVLAGLLLMFTANRAVAVFAGYLGAVAGAWFVVGPVLLPHLPDSWDIGTPVGGAWAQTWEQLGFFTGLGAVIIFIASQAAGRVTVRSLRDGRLVDTRDEALAHDDSRGSAYDRDDSRGSAYDRDSDTREAHVTPVDTSERNVGSRSVGSTDDDQQLRSPQRMEKVTETTRRTESPRDEARRVDTTSDATSDDDVLRVARDRDREAAPTPETIDLRDEVRTTRNDR